MYIKHYEGIAEFKEEFHNCIVFDDANLRHLRSEQQVLNFLDLAVEGAKTDIRHLYHCKHISTKVPLVLTVNTLAQLFPVLTRQVSRRIIIIKLEQFIKLSENVDPALKESFNQHNLAYNDEIQINLNAKL